MRSFYGMTTVIGLVAISLQLSAVFTLLCGDGIVHAAEFSDDDVYVTACNSSWLKCEGPDTNCTTYRLRHGHCLGAMASQSGGASTLRCRNYDQCVHGASFWGPSCSTEQFHAVPLVHECNRCSGSVGELLACNPNGTQNNWTLYACETCPRNGTEAVLASGEAPPAAWGCSRAFGGQFGTCSLIREKTQAVLSELTPKPCKRVVLGQGSVSYKQCPGMTCGNCSFVPGSDYWSFPSDRCQWATSGYSFSVSCVDKSNRHHSSSAKRTSAALPISEMPKETADAFAQYLTTHMKQQKV